MPGSVYKTKSLDSVYDAIRLPSFKDITENKRKYAESFYTQYINTDPFSGQRMVESYGEHLYVVQNPAAKPLTTAEMDRVYGLNYMRTYHPSYEAAGGVPAIEEVKFSLVKQPGLFWRLQFLRPYFSSGTNYPDPEP